MSDTYSNSTGRPPLQSALEAPLDARAAEKQEAFTRAYIAANIAGQTRFDEQVLAETGALVKKHSVNGKLPAEAKGQIDAHIQLRSDLAKALVETFVAKTAEQPPEVVIEALQSVNKDLRELRKANKQGGGTASRIAGAYMAAVMDSLETAQSALKPLQRHTIKNIERPAYQLGASKA